MSQLFYTPEEVDVNERGEFETLIIPESFEQALSYAEQLIWLYKNKQNKLVEGGGVTLTDNADGTTTISVSSDIKGIESIESTVGTTKTVVKITLTDGSVETFDVMAGPQGPAGADGRQGVDGVGISNIAFKEIDNNGNYVYTITLTDSNTYDITSPRGPKGKEISTIEVDHYTYLSDPTRYRYDIEGGITTSTKLDTLRFPSKVAFLITYDDNTTDTVAVFAQAATYIRSYTYDHDASPTKLTIRFVTLDPSKYSSGTGETFTDIEVPNNELPAIGNNGDVLVKNSSASGGIEWKSINEVYPHADSWYGNVAMIDKDAIPTSIDFWDDPGHEELIPVDISFQKVYNGSDQLVGLVFTATNTSSVKDVEVTNINLCLKCIDGSPTITGESGPTYGSGGFWYSGLTNTINLGWSALLPAGATESISITITPVSGFDIETTYNYNVVLLDAKNGVPSASQASSGDVLTADGSGGCGWGSNNQVPSASSASDGDVLTANGQGGYAWETPSGGGGLPTGEKPMAVVQYYNNTVQWGPPIVMPNEEYLRHIWYQGQTTNNNYKVNMTSYIANLTVGDIISSYVEGITYGIYISPTSYTVRILVSRFKSKGKFTLTQATNVPSSSTLWFSYKRTTTYDYTTADSCARRGYDNPLTGAGYGVYGSNSRRYDAPANFIKLSDGTNTYLCLAEMYLMLTNAGRTQGNQLSSGKFEIQVRLKGGAVYD